MEGKNNDFPRIRKISIVIILSLIAIMSSVVVLTSVDIIAKWTINNNSLSEDSAYIISLEDEEAEDRIDDGKIYSIIYEKEHEDCSKVYSQLTATFDYLRIDYITSKVDEKAIINDQINQIYILVKSLGEIENIEEILDYAREGGTIVFLIPPDIDKTFLKYYSEFGFVEQNGYKSSYGITIEPNVLLNKEKLTLTEDKNIWNASISANIKKGAEIYAYDESENPLIWKYNYGLGSIVFNNNYMITQKSFRGFIPFFLSTSEELMIYPVVNSYQIVLEAFPGPIPTGELIDSSGLVKLNYHEFFKDYWWGDMLAISKMYNLIYTGSFLEGYKSNNQGEIAQYVSEHGSDYVYFAKELIDSGGYLGVYGYHNEPITSLSEVRMLDSIIGEFLPNYLVDTYSSPRGLQVPIGIEELSEGLEWIQFVCGVYDGRDDMYIQELGSDENGLVMVPNFTSGYDISSFDTLKLYSLCNLHGMISHNIYPIDEVYENDMDWNSLKEEYLEFIKMIDGDFQWINKGSTAQTGYNELISEKLDLSYYEDKEKNNVNIKLHNNYDTAYLFLYSTKGIDRSINCKVEDIGINRYLLEIEDDECKIYFEKQ